MFRVLLAACLAFLFVAASAQAPPAQPARISITIAGSRPSVILIAAALQPAQ